MSSPSGTEASTTSSSPNSVVATAGAGGNNAPKYGTLVPNRVFVGGISSSTTEAELAQLFSAYGNVRATKIINDRAGVSKGYGFVTFETEEEARRLQAEGDCIVLKERKLNIAPAIKKQAAVYPLQPFNRGYETTTTVPSGTVFFHNGYPYTYHNGMAFFAAGANNTQDVAAAAAAANGYVASPYPQPQPPPAYPGTTVMFQQPMYIPQQYQYQTLPPSSPVPSQYVYTSAAANSPLYGTTNGVGGGNGGGGNGNSGGGGGPPTMTASNHHQPPTTFYATGPPPTSTLPPSQGPPAMSHLTMPPPPPQHHHPQPSQAQMAIPEVYVTGPTTAIYAQQAAYPIPVPEMFETPPMTELSSAQSTEDSSSTSSRSGPSNQSNDASKVNGEDGAKITPSTPVVSLLRLNLQDEAEDEAEGGGSIEGETQDQDDARRNHKNFRTSVQQPFPQHKRSNINGINSHQGHHRPQYHRPNHIHQNSTASQPLFYLAPNYIHSPNHFPNSPHASGYYGPPPPINGPQHPSSPHIHNPSGRGQHHGGGRPPLPHDQRHLGRPRPNHRTPHSSIPEGKKYSPCLPEGLLSCRSPPLQASTTLMYTPMGIAAPGVNMGNGGGRQQHRRYASGPRRQGGRGGGGGGGGGDASDGIRQIRVLPSSGQQRQRVGKCNKTINGTRQVPVVPAGLSGAMENMPRDGSGDGQCMPITPPGTPSPATAGELATPVAAVGPEIVCQMQALTL